MSGLKTRFDEGASRRLVDVVESWNGLHLSSNSPIANAADFRSSMVPSVAPTNIILLGTNLGATGAVGYDALVGRTIQVWASAAAATANGSAAVSSFTVPMGRRFALAGAIPLALLPPLRRYRVDFLPRVTVAGAAELVCGLGEVIGGLVNGNNPAFMWSSRLGTNAGRWMPRYRLVAAGAVTDGPDSGVAPANFHQCSLVYEEGLTPRVRWLVDGAELLQLAGDAFMATIATTAQFLLTKGLSAPVGTTVQFAETRFRCEEL